MKIERLTSNLVYLEDVQDGAVVDITPSFDPVNKDDNLYLKIEEKEDSEFGKIVYLFSLHNNNVRSLAPQNKKVLVYKSQVSFWTPTTKIEIDNMLKKEE